VCNKEITRCPELTCAEKVAKSRQSSRNDDVAEETKEQPESVEFYDIAATVPSHNNYSVGPTLFVK